MAHFLGISNTFKYLYMDPPSLHFLCTLIFALLRPPPLPSGLGGGYGWVCTGGVRIFLKDGQGFCSSSLLAIALHSGLHFFIFILHSGLHFGDGLAWGQAQVLTLLPYCNQIHFCSSYFHLSYLWLMPVLQQFVYHKLICVSQFLSKPSGYSGRPCCIRNLGCFWPIPPRKHTLSSAEPLFFVGDLNHTCQSDGKRRQQTTSCNFTRKLMF